MPDQQNALSPPGHPKEISVRSPMHLRGWLVGGVAGSALLLYAAFEFGCVGSLFGPPAVVMTEAYADDRAGPPVDHALFDQLLKAHVSSGGWVDYDGLRKDANKLDRYIESLSSVPFDELARDEKLAFLLNAYNAFTLRLILDYYPVKSIMDIPKAKRFEDRRWHLTGRTFSLNEIENERIRPKFVEPRVHFALVCAAIGCPPLRAEAYRGDRIGSQLDDQTRYVHTHPRWLRYDAGANTIHLTRLYDWYGGDFETRTKSVLAFAARYVPILEKKLKQGDAPRIKWLAYDWTLNDRKNKAR